MKVPRVAGHDPEDETDAPLNSTSQPLAVGNSGWQTPASSCRRHMETYMADVEWEPLPTPMWPEGSVMADLPGLFLEASFDQGVPTWKVQRDNGKNALPDLISSGTADSIEAAKAAALHVAEGAAIV
jgi:hypothetical protein